MQIKSFSEMLRAQGVIHPEKGRFGGDMRGASGAAVVSWLMHSQPHPLPSCLYHLPSSPCIEYSPFTQSGQWKVRKVCREASGNTIFLPEKRKGNGKELQMPLLPLSFCLEFIHGARSYSSHLTSRVQKAWRKKPVMLRMVEKWGRVWVLHKINKLPYLA